MALWSVMRCKFMCAIRAVNQEIIIRMKICFAYMFNDAAFSSLFDFSSMHCCIPSIQEKHKTIIHRIAFISVREFLPWHFSLQVLNERMRWNEFVLHFSADDINLRIFPLTRMAGCYRHNDTSRTDMSRSLIVWNLISSLQGIFRIDSERGKKEI